MYSHLVCSFMGSCKNLIAIYKVQRKKKDKEMFKYSLFSFLSGAVFSHRLSIGLSLATAALYSCCRQSIYYSFQNKTLWIPAKYKQ